MASKHIGEGEDDQSDDDDENVVQTSEVTSNAKCVESDDVDPTKMTLWTSLFNSMNPAVCLAPAVACSNVFLDDDVVDYGKIVPGMLLRIKHGGKARTEGLQQLYRFTDREHGKNRVPVVCSTRFQTLDVLIPCLSEECSAVDRRQALLVINNLCIPNENKRCILLGPSRDMLLSSLLNALRLKLPETHLVSACLFNLSFYEPTRTMLFQYVAPSVLQHSPTDVPEQYSFTQPTDKRDSFIRVLEKVVRDFVPYYVDQCKSMKYRSKEKLTPSVESSTLRWSMCLLRNLAQDPERATLLATTTSFPAAALQMLQATKSQTDLVHWSHDSLPEACLVFWVWLVQASKEVCLFLHQEFGQEAALPALQILDAIAALPGIQGVRAKMVATRLSEATEEEGLSTLASF